MFLVSDRTLGVHFSGTQLWRFGCGHWGVHLLVVNVSPSSCFNLLELAWISRRKVPLDIDLVPSWSQFQGKLAQPNFPLKLQTSGQRLAMLVGWSLGCGRLDEMWILRDDAEDWWKWCIVWYTVYNIYYIICIYIYHLFVYSADLKSTDLNHKLTYEICTQCTQCTQLFSV